MLFNFSAGYAIRKVQGNKVIGKRVGTHQILLYVDVVNLLDEINTLRIKTETLIDFSKEFDIEVKVEKIKYVLMSRHQNVGQNYDIKTANRFFDNE
jgi:hypothetical protein